MSIRTACDITGLSEDAINRLQEAEYEYTDKNLLSRLIASDNFRYGIRSARKAEEMIKLTDVKAGKGDGAMEINGNEGCSITLTGVYAVKSLQQNATFCFMDAIKDIIRKEAIHAPQA
jgi:hypothetical protein